MNALKVDTEKKIIKTAKEVFIEKGLQGARMQEIADRAGINKALLHYYFRSKDKLFDAVFQDITAQLLPEFSKVMGENKDKSMLELVKSFVGFYNKFFQENPFLPQFFFHEIWQHPDKLADMIKSQDINPGEIAGELSKHLPENDSVNYLPQHMIANVLGMTLFPHIARPLFQRILFNNDDELYDQFLSERTDVLVKLMSGVLEKSPTMEDEAPDEDF